MKNQDMPANPVSHATLTELPDLCVTESTGETKYEKAFWQVYSAMCTDGDVIDCNALAEFAIKATDAGFKALEERDND